MKFDSVKFAALVVCGALAVQAHADEVETFGKWRVSVGGGFNGAVRSDVGMRNLPVPAGYSVGAGLSQAEAWRRARNHQYEGGGYIAADALDNGWNTENWKLPTSSYRENGHFVLDSDAYREVVGSSSSIVNGDMSSDAYPFGLSFEVSRELWLHDEPFEHRWGVDFAAGFSYYFQHDVYRSRGVSTRTDTIREGVVRTEFSDPDAMYDYDHGIDHLGDDDMYGHGTYYNDFVSPALRWDRVNERDPYDVGGTRTVSASRSFSARGDYQELEMLFMFRPWYEITDWWRVYGEVGVGVSWGLFQSEVAGSGFGCGEDFSQWDCYGVAGLGTMFRYGIFDLSVDFLGRFLRDDLDVDGKYLSGSIKRADWGFRVMVGVEF